MKIKIIIAILIVILIHLQYRIWIGDGSYEEVRLLKHQIKEQEAENKKLLERNEALEAEVNDLKKGLKAVEERAREELGMVKEEEKFYQVIEDE